MVKETLLNRIEYTLRSNRIRRWIQNHISNKLRLLHKNIPWSHQKVSSWYACFSCHCPLCELVNIFTFFPRGSLDNTSPLQPHSFWSPYIHWIDLLLTPRNNGRLERTKDWPCKKMWQANWRDTVPYSANKGKVSLHIPEECLVTTQCHLSLTQALLIFITLK